jgi:3-mercaptopyruvate sulfurtransferase SseA
MMAGARSGCILLKHELTANLPQADLASRLEEVPQDRPICVICQAGYRALRAARFLKQMGYRQVANVTGGTAAWIAASQPLVEEKPGVETPRVAESEWTHAGAYSYTV